MFAPGPDGPSVEETLQRAPGAGFSRTAFAASPSPPTVAPGFKIQKIAAAPKSATNCDDLAYLDGHLFMTCQSLTQSVGGGGGNSTIAEYA
ncbi:MAG: hypothetical protein M3065_09160, partial [Actinomycetota bacterium]|nr:hypothetical protein [Actinomycetota bacterium]